MKKISLASILIISIISMQLTYFSAAATESLYSVMLDEDFENGCSVFEISEGTEYNNVFDAEGTGIGKAYSGRGYRGGIAFDKTYLLTDCSLEGANSFVETEFDILIKNADEFKQGTFRIQLHTSAVTDADPNFTAEFTALVFDFSQKKICISTTGGSNITLCDFEAGKWYRAKIVIHNTDSQAARKSKISAVYINGENMLSEEASFASTNSAKLLYYDRITTKQSGLGGGTAYWKMDNVSVKKYNSATGISPVPDKARLISLVRKGEELLKEEFRFVNDKYKLEKAIRTAKTAYFSDDAKSIASGIKNMEDCIFQIGVYDGNVVAYDDFEGESAALFELGREDWFDVYKIGNAYTSSGVNSRTFEKIYPFSSGNAPWSEEYNSSRMGADCYAETEFDIYFKQLCHMNAKCQLSLTSDVIAQSEATGIAMLTFDGETGAMILRALGEENSAVTLSSLEDKKWYRIKIVAQITDENCDAVKKISQVYINGSETLSAPVGFSSLSSHKIPYFNLIKLSGVSDFTGVNCYLDNIKVSRFNGSENLSENTDMLLSGIREAEERLKAMHKYSDTDKYRELERKINNAKLTYEQENLLTDSAALCAEKLKNATVESYMLEETIESIQPVFEDENGKTQHFLKGADSIKNVILKNSLPFKKDGKLYAAVYEQGGGLVSAAAQEFSVGAKGTAEIPLDFSIKDYTEDKDIKLFFWDKNLASLGNQRILKGLTEQKEKWSIEIDGLRVETDVQPRLTYSGELMVPAENICRILGIDFSEYDDFSAAERSDGKRVEMVNNSNCILIDGEEFLLSEEIYEEEQILMVPLSALGYAFGFDYSVDEKTLALCVTSDYKENLRSADSSDISVTSKVYSASFKIPYGNPLAKAEVWVRMNRDSITGWSTTAEEAGLNDVLVEDGFSAFVWRKAYTADYSDGGFCGSFGNLRKGGRYYDVKVRITEDGEVSDEFIAERLFKTKNDGNYTNSELAPKSEDGVTLIPTYENMSFYVDKNGAENCEITYKEKNSDVSVAVLKPYYSEEASQFSGSITGLKENTAYIVTAVLTDGTGNVIKTVSKEAVTWQENPPIAREIDLNDIYEGGTLVLENLCGSEDGWIKIDCKGAVIDGGKNNPEAIYIYGCKYLILENAVVKGGYRSGINVTGDSEFVRISNMDISGWSRYGIFNEDKKLYIRNGVSAGYNGGINLLDVSNITIERCYIHDSNARANSWSGESWAFVHPSGSEGIVYKAKTGLVIRYNDIIGNDYHRWNDGMEGYLNGLRLSGPGFDGDIYGNMITQANDDGLEVDSGGRNIRIYKNRFEHNYVGISTAPLMCGPLYIFRNLMTDIKSQSIKTGSSSDGNNGVQYVINNTIDSSDAMGNSNSHIAFTRNNIFASSGKYKGSSISNPSADERSSYDYDITLGAVKLPEGSEKNGIVAMPEYKDKENGIYILNADSLAANSGVNIPGFDKEVSDGKTDIGAFELGSGFEFLPYRPIDITADKYSVTLKPGESKTVTFTKKEGTECFSIRFSETSKWLSVSGAESGEISGGDKVSLTLYCDDIKLTPTDEQTTVLFRTESGYSVPVTVRIDR